VDTSQINVSDLKFLYSGGYCLLIGSQLQTTKSLETLALGHGTTIKTSALLVEPIHSTSPAIHSPTETLMRRPGETPTESFSLTSTSHRPRWMPSWTHPWAVEVRWRAIVVHTNVGVRALRLGHLFRRFRVMTPHSCFAKQ
jgi:hypothetical protein